MKDHSHERPTHFKITFSETFLSCFHVNQPLFKDHSSFKTTFVWLCEWSEQRDSTVFLPRELVGWELLWTTLTWSLFFQPIHEVIHRDEDTKKIQNIINAGMASNGQNLQNYLSTWDNYREIWEIQKDAFIRRYQKLNPQVSSFDADIARWVESWFPWGFFVLGWRVGGGWVEGSGKVWE